MIRSSRLSCEANGFVRMMRNYGTVRRTLDESCAGCSQHQAFICRTSPLLLQARTMSKGMAKKRRTLPPSVIVVCSFYFSVPNLCSDDHVLTVRDSCVSNVGQICCNSHLCALERAAGRNRHAAWHGQRLG